VRAETTPGTRPLIALTGVSGFIGGAVEAELSGTVRLRGLFRSAGPARTRWEEAGHEVVEGSMHDRAALERLVEGADRVIHLAARGGRGDPAESHRVNVAGTEDLARAAGAAGVRRLVYVSSISVFAATEPSDGLVTEETEPVGISSLNPYSRTKYEGEVAIRRLTEGGTAPPWTVVRPTNVYGPWGRSWVLDWLDRLQRVPLALGVGLPVDLVHVSDVARGIVTAATRPHIDGRVIHLGHESVPLATYLGHLARDLLGRRVLTLPAPLDWMVRAGVDLGHGLLHRDRPSLPLLRQVRYPTDRARALLDWNPRVPLSEGIAALARWYRSEYLPSADRHAPGS